MKVMTDTETRTQESDSDCRHHWLLGQPRSGQITAVCKLCGRDRLYPAVLDDLDPGIESDNKDNSLSAATAAGGARPSSSASSARRLER